MTGIGQARATAAAIAAVALFSATARAERGLASTYTDTEVACPGERFDAKALTAAHRTLPCGSMVKVTNLDNGMSVVVKIVDRGPCGTPECRRDHPEYAVRIIDLTPAAADRIDSAGMVKVELIALTGFEARWELVQDALPKPDGHRGSHENAPRPPQTGRRGAIREGKAAKT